MLMAPLDEQAIMAAVSDIRQALSYVEGLANCFDERSMLSKVNREAAAHPVVVDEELMLMLRMCKEYHRLTDGLFDVTVESTRVEGQPAIDSLVLGDLGDVRFLRDGLRLNLSGFLKGYALENIRHLLGEHGIADALVSLGQSSILATGDRLTVGSGWNVTAGSEQVVLYNECLTTSGNATPEHRHIVNPLTGQYAEGRRAVAVVTSNGIEGEVLSTSLFLADDTQRQQLIDRFAIRTVIDVGFVNKNPNKLS